MRTKIEVDRQLLTQVLRRAEDSKQYPNRSALFTDAAERYNAVRSPNLREITAAIVGLRAKDWEIQLTTPLGKRGRAPGFKGGPRGPRKSKREKFVHIAPFFEALKAKTPTKYHPLVDRAAAGSRTAAQRLHCLECSGWSTAEVRKCPVTCALWPFRPSLEVETTEVAEVAEVGETTAEEKEAA